MTQYRVYAWHSVPLSKHLLNVYRVFRYLFDRETRVIVRKVALLKDTRPSPDLEEQLEKIIHLAVVLHDAGKGLQKYQDRTRKCIAQIGERVTDDSKCFCSFRWHEAVSAQIYSLYTQYYLYTITDDPTPAHKFAVAIGLLSILHHHHAMRLIYDGKWMEEVDGQHLVEGAVDEISAALTEAGFPPLSEVFPDPDLDEVRRAGSTAASQLPRIIRREGRGLIGKEIGSMVSYLKFHEAVTSRLVIADVVAASLERSGQLKGYADELARELRLRNHRRGDKMSELSRLVERVER